MSSFNMRPRFKHTVIAVQEELEKELLKGIKQKETTFVFNYLPGHLYIKIHPDEQHFWSPQLHLSFEQDQDQVIIRGLYGPNPTVWAIFFFGYVILGLLALFIGMWGLTKWSLGMDYTVLWIIPILGVLALMLYFSAQAGQKLGAQQMYDIHHAYEELTGNHVKVE